jgi:hypothetical protein
VNTLDLMTKLFIFVIALLAMFEVGFVVEAAGRQAAYLAGFRNRSKFFAVITDVSAFFCR